MSSEVNAFIELVETGDPTPFTVKRTNARRHIPTGIERQNAIRKLDIDLEDLIVEKQKMMFGLLEKMNKYAMRIVENKDFSKKGREIYEKLNFAYFDRTMIKTSETDSAPYTMNDIDIEVYNYSVEEGPNNVSKRIFLYNLNTSKGRLIVFKNKKSGEYIGVADFLDPDFRSMLVTNEEKEGFNDLVKLANLYMKLKYSDNKKHRLHVERVIAAVFGGIAIAVVPTIFTGGAAALAITAAVLGGLLSSGGTLKAFMYNPESLQSQISKYMPYLSYYRHPNTAITAGTKSYRFVPQVRPMGGYRNKTRKSSRTRRGGGKTRRADRR